MRTTSTFMALVGSAAAFPHMAAKMAEELYKRQGQIVPSLPLSEGDYQGAPQLVFNAQDQYVSNQGDHAYRAPNFAAGDTRGPCPGLNALANHGYIDHSGVTNLVEAIQGTTAGFNMGADLAGFLSTISVLLDGNIPTTKWSIGSGGGSGGLASLGGILGGGTGLTGSHNKYETDSSPMRGDFYEYCGNNYEVQLSQYQVLYDYYKGVPDDEVSFTFSDLAKFRNYRFSQSVSENPNFVYGPFSGLIVSQAAFTFIPAFMSNHSAEFTNGKLTRQTLNSFFGVTENNSDGKGGGTLSYAPGTEKIPDNWYRRSSTVPYSIPLFALDVFRIGAEYPQIVSIGGNTNGVNTFSGVTLGDTFGSAFALENLAQGNTAACLVYQVGQQVVLDQVRDGLVGTLLNTATGLVSKYLAPPTALSCPSLEAKTAAQKLNGYPGVENGSQTKCS